MASRVRSLNCAAPDPETTSMNQSLNGKTGKGWKDSNDESLPPLPLARAGDEADAPVDDEPAPVACMVTEPVTEPPEPGCAAGEAGNDGQ
eukprot:15471909-Alexandrium_andersonii.AAC.1